MFPYGASFFVTHLRSSLLIKTLSRYIAILSIANP